MLKVTSDLKYPNIISNDEIECPNKCGHKIALMKRFYFLNSSNKTDFLCNPRKKLGNLNVWPISCFGSAFKKGAPIYFAAAKIKWH